MKLLRPLILLALVLGLCAPARPAQARLDARADWSYAEYHADIEGKGDFDASHFLQRYSLFWNKSDLLYDGRAGYYALGLGAEWNILDSDIDGESFDVTTFKPLYNAEVLIAPGALPFRLKAYVRDSHATTPTYSPQASLSGVFQPNIFDDLRNGQRIATGMTLLAGIKNGSYRGQYRDILSQFPKLLVDFRSLYVRNLKANNEEHYLERELAFVSLNKKDNWFHYRYTDFQDFVDETNNMVEKSYMLGTVDHLLTRQWVNFTNWLAISADGSYTNGNLRDVENSWYEEYRFNFMAQARLQDFYANQFTYFNRERDPQKLVKSLGLPLFLSGRLGRHSTWRAQVESALSETAFDPEVALQSKEEFDNRFRLRSRIDIQRNRAYNLAFEVETTARNKEDELEESRSYTGNLEAEIASNSRLNRPYRFFGGYGISYVYSEIDRPETDLQWASHDKGNYVENRLSGEIVRFWRLFEAGARQDVIWGVGELQQGDLLASSAIRGDEAPSQSAADRADQGSDGIFRSITNLHLETRLGRDLHNRVEFTNDFLSREKRDDIHIMTLRHRLAYNRRTLAVGSSTEITWGEGVDAPVLPNSEQTLATGPGKVDYILRNGLSLAYTPSRVWDTRVDSELTWTQADNDILVWLLRQELRYNFYKTNGIVRKLADLQENFRYDRTFQEVGQEEWNAELSLRGNLFPYRFLTLGMGLEYEWIDSASAHQYGVETLASILFPKLQLHLSYNYGSASGLREDNGTEHRWEITVSKTL